MIVANSDLVQEALDRSLEVREEAGIPYGVPLNVYDLCERLTPKVRVRFADYSIVYGSLGSAVATLVWLYITALAVFLGAEYNAQVEADRMAQAESVPTEAKAQTV